MTTKPKAKMFRIRRNVPLDPAPENPPKPNPAVPSTRSSKTSKPAPEQTEDGFGSAPYPTAAKKAAIAPSVSDLSDIDGIKQEGLTGRQLRMARRVAHKYGLTATSDYDAVRQLRVKGIDPFQRAALLELVVPDTAKKDVVKVPKTLENPNVPSTEIMTEDVRAREIYKIQRDIARRRRRQSMLLLTRLGFFVLLPTLMVGFYFFNIATPLYATKSEFLIQQADSPAGGGLGGLFSGTGFATSQDSITVQSYLQSRDAMLRLDKDIGFKSHFSQDFVDPLTRLEIDSTNEKAYKLFQRLVKIGYDPTEGIVKMEVVAAEPQVSESFSRALIDYAEQQVDNLTQRLREDQMQGARDSFVDAENKMLEAQNLVLDMQERLGVIDPVSETSALMGQISNFETQLQEKGLQLQQLMDNASPNQARVDGVKGDVSRLESLVAELRSQLTEGGSETSSLARMGGELRMAELNLQTRQAMMQQSLQQLETARIAANRQVRYLSLGVSPTAPDEATYPRAFENTLVSFLIFAGIYLMVSLTASILREQVSA
jgi:capsular polysaccharide transport system permease protein